MILPMFFKPISITKEKDKIQKEFSSFFSVVVLVSDRFFSSNKTKCVN